MVSVTTMKAVKNKGPGIAEFVTDAPIPKVIPEKILVKVAAVGLNPTDWKHIDFISGESFNHTVGCDFSGVVEEVGEGVTYFKPGDRVAGLCHGVKKDDPTTGSYGEYAIARAGNCMKIPDSLSFADAATLGVGVITVGQSLYQSMGMPLPGLGKSGSSRTQLLIYGASSCMGMYAVMYAKLSGLSVIGVCSARNFDLVKSLGADEVIDYKDPEKCVQEIRRLTDGKLLYAMDCISEEATAKICSDALSTTEKGVKYRALLNIKAPREDVDSAWTLGYTAFGESFTFGDQVMPASEVDYKFITDFVRLTEKLLAEGKFRTVKPTVREGGLERILEGVDDLRNNRVSGAKLVYPL